MNFTCWHFWSIHQNSRIPSQIVTKVGKNNMHMPFKEWGFPRGSAVKNPLASARNAGDMSLIPGFWRSLEEGMVTHSSILAWRIPWTEEHGGLQSMASQRVGHHWSDWALSKNRNIPFAFKMNVLFFVSWSFCWIV